jgi:hypothetical protein
MIPFFCAQQDEICQNKKHSSIVRIQKDKTTGAQQFALPARPRSERLLPLPPTLLARPRPVGSGNQFLDSFRELLDSFRELLFISRKQGHFNPIWQIKQKNREHPPRPPVLLSENAQAFQLHRGKAVRCAFTKTV